MELQLEPLPITKEIILSKVSEETIMEHYLGTAVRKGLFRSPLRRDSNPTCAFYRNKKGDLIFKDFGSKTSGNFITVVMEKFGVSYYSALQIIANDFGIIKRPKLAKNKPKMEYTNTKFEETEGAVIQIQNRDFQQYELDWWAKYGITPKTLKKYKVYSVQNVWLNGNQFHYEQPNQLVFGYFGGIKDGIEQWRIYFPKQKKYRFISNWKQTQIQGAGRLSPEGGEYLIITKSLKDCLVFYELGLQAIAPISENLFVTETQYEKLKSKYQNIILLYDNDLPGVLNANKIRKKFTDLNVLIIPRKYGAKDISDFCKKYGKEKTLELIEQAKIYINDKRSKTEEAEK